MKKKFLTIFTLFMIASIALTACNVASDSCTAGQWNPFQTNVKVPVDGRDPYATYNACGSDGKWHYVGADEVLVVGTTPTIDLEVETPPPPAEEIASCPPPVTSKAVPCEQPTVVVEPPPCELCEEEPRSWEGDNFGPEKSLPNTIDNEFGAIVELWDGADYCASVPIYPGESFNGAGWKGAYWNATSEYAVEDRFPHHTPEYLEDYPECEVLESVEDIP